MARLKLAADAETGEPTARPMPAGPGAEAGAGADGGEQPRDVLVNLAPYRRAARRIDATLDRMAAQLDDLKAEVENFKFPGPAGAPGAVAAPGPAGGGGGRPAA